MSGFASTRLQNVFVVFLFMSTLAGPTQGADSYPWPEVIKNPKAATKSDSQIFNDLFYEFYSKGPFAGAEQLEEPTLSELLARGSSKPLQCEGIYRNGKIVAKFEIAAEPSFHERFLTFNKVPAEASIGQSLVSTLWSPRVSGWVRSTCSDFSDSSGNRAKVLAASLTEKDFLASRSIGDTEVTANRGELILMLGKKASTTGPRYLIELSHGPIHSQRYPDYISEFAGQRVGYRDADLSIPISQLNEFVELGTATGAAGSACAARRAIAAYFECK